MSKKNKKYMNKNSNNNRAEFKNENEQCGGKNCNCGDDCKCNDENKCNDDCQCDDNVKSGCQCGEDCHCGDDCKCNDENKCNEDCQCSDNVKSGCQCGEDCHCGDDSKCSDESKCNEDCQCGCGENCHCSDELAKEVESLNAKLKKEKDDYLRLLAEFETFRARSAEDRVNIINSASADIIKGLLPVLDDCERALKLLETSSDSNAKEGTSLIYEKLMAYLKKNGLEVIESKGKKFDTDFHEAIAQIPSTDDMKGCIIDVVETGYILNGKILRFAKVVVGV